MEDLSDVLKRNFLGLYKKQHDVVTVKQRVVKQNELRKVNRHEEVFRNRKIPLNMSPAVTPAPKPTKTSTKSPTKDPKVVKRLEMLAKWKEERKRREGQKKTLKPAFKVSHVAVDVGLPNLENVNFEIKGKSFKSRFAPLNHQFKPPSNIKPIHFNSATNSTNNTNTKRVQKEEKKKKGDQVEAVGTHTMMTRSRARSNNIATVKTKKSRRKAETETKKNQNSIETNEEDKEKKKSTETSLVPPDVPVQSTNSGTTTPTKTESIPPPYISPFVTVSRGKNSARKEYKARRSGKLFSTKESNCTSPKAGAAYFTWLVNSHISRLRDICDQWTKHKEENELAEEATSMIDVAIGQTNLLITKKFVQFQGLIKKCDEKNSETLVTCEDLHGFWDMIHLQVVNLDKRFDGLENLKANNWQEILPEVKKDSTKKKGRPVKNAKASAGLKAAIEAARRRRQAQNIEDVEIAAKNKTPQNRRSSNRVVDVRTSETTRRNSSPGLMIMKVAQYAKTVETPAKSILKVNTHRSAKSMSKSVLFEDEVDGSADAENDLNKTNLQAKTKTPTRRSMRLTKTKLF